MLKKRWWKNCFPGTIVLEVIVVSNFQLYCRIPRTPLNPSNDKYHTIERVINYNIIGHVVIIKVKLSRAKK